ncbi:MAG: hypothetical protein ABIH17_10415, partial [Pseudomonadota bacterium]
ALPGMYLRDEVVERLRVYGLHLTPQPLTHTAHEYYNMQYDRTADIHGPLGRRKPAKAAEADEIEDEDVDEPAVANGGPVAAEADLH